jgi:hypothetical protein
MTPRDLIRELRAVDATPEVFAVVHDWFVAADEARRAYQRDKTREHRARKTAQAAEEQVTLRKVTERSCARSVSSSLGNTNRR